MGALPRGWFQAVPQELCPEGCGSVGARVLCRAVCSAARGKRIQRERESLLRPSPKALQICGVAFESVRGTSTPTGKKTFNNAKIGAAGEFPIPLAQEATFADLERILLLGTDAFDDTWKPIPAVAGREAPEPLCFQCCPST